jgi:hypothetical protein
MFRIHEYKGFKLLAVRRRGVQVKFFMNSLFQWTRILIHNKYVPSYKQVGYTVNEDYNDWRPFEELPKHIPEDQWFTYYKVMWRKYKDEVQQ